MYVVSMLRVHVDSGFGGQGVRWRTRILNSVGPMGRGGGRV